MLYMDCICCSLADGHVPGGAFQTSLVWSPLHQQTFARTLRKLQMPSHPTALVLFPILHPDSGRERISSKNVAHIMNNEAQRKYLVSVKRLMTYLQDKRTDIPPSKKVR